jgi:two-component system, OmpR family, response regulator MprA
MTQAAGSAILVVEDEDTIREFVCELLRDEGYDVYEASDGETAIDALRHHRPPPDRLCLVILDMMLPRSDGVQVLGALAELDSYVPVIAVSANGEQLTRAVQAGAGAALPKPYDLDRLLALVERNCHPARNVITGEAARRSDN